MILFTAGAAAETRYFVSLAGSLLQAEIIGVSADTVSLKRTSDGQILPVKIDSLCREDRDYISRWMEAHPDMASEAPGSASQPAAPVQNYSMACQTLPSKSSSGPQVGAMRSVELSYTFKISNREVQRDLSDATGVVVTLARDVADPSSDLILLQKEIFDVDIRAQSKMTHTTQPVVTTYSQTAGNNFGVKSQGYVLIIHDAAGNILFTEASPDSGAKFAKEILAIEKVPCLVDRDFKVKEDALPMAYISF